MKVDMKVMKKIIIYLMLFLAFVFYPKNPVQAQSTQDFFSIDTWGGGITEKAAEENTYLVEYVKDNIFKCSCGNASPNYYFAVIKGKCSLTDVSITYYDARGNNKKAVVQDGEFKLVINQNDGDFTIGYDGSSVAYIHVISKINKVDETFPLIYDTSSDSAVADTIKHGYTEIYLYDETNKKVISEDSDFNRTDHKVKSKTLNLDSNIKAVSVQVYRDFEHVASSTTGLYWIPLGENYISVNGTAYQKFANTSETLGINRSPAIYLKKGLNIIEVLSCQYQASVRATKGISTLNARGNDSCVYLLYWDGEEITSNSSNDTSIKYIDVTQIGKSSVPCTQYNVKKDNGNFIVALPETMPVYSNSSLDDILLGIVLNDPSSTYEIKTPEPIGLECGIYHTVTVGNTVEKIEVEVTAVDGTKKTHYIELKHASGNAKPQTCSITGADLLDYETKESTSFDEEKNYYAFKSTQENMDLSVSVPEGVTYTINDGKTIDSQTNIIKLEVTAADTVTKNTYYFFKIDDNKNVISFTIPESTKKLAKSMLWAWDARSEEQKKEDMWGDFWNLYKQVATDPDFDLNGSYVKIPVDAPFNQATDYARVIIELVILGENPYHYNGHNYVQELLDCGGGAFANNVWYLLAAKAAGVDESKITSMTASVKTQVLNSGYDVDINGWNLAVSALDLTPAEIMNIVEYMQDYQVKSGNSAGLLLSPFLSNVNSMTNGCVLSGMVGAGVDIESLLSLTTTDTQKIVNPLTATRDTMMTADGQFYYDSKGNFPGFNKDIIIALGDISNGSTFYQRYNLTLSKAKELLKEAKELNTSEATEAEISDLQSKIKALEEGIKDLTDEDALLYGLGEAYYALQDEMYIINPSLKISYRTISPKEGTIVDSINEAIEKIDKDNYLASAQIITEAKTDYDSLSDEAKVYVKNAEALTTAIEQLNLLQIKNAVDKITALGKVSALTTAKEADLIAAKEAYDALTDAQKEEVTNAEMLPNFFTRMEILKVEELIEALPTKISLTDEAAIIKAEEAYKALSSEQKRNMLSEDVYTLKQARKALDTLKAIKPVVKLSASKATIYAVGSGSTVTLSLTADGKKVSNTTATWKSSNTSIATVSKGVITGKKAGSVTITATYANVSVKCTVTVKKQTGAISASKATLYTKGVNHKLTLTFKENGSKISASKVTWTSSKTSVATVSKGVITGKKAGSATITAKYNGQKFTCKVTVKAPSLKLKKTKATIKKGSKTTITYTMTPKTSVVFKSANTKIATVNFKGVVTGKKAGTVKIKVTGNGLTTYFTVTVK